MSSSSPLHVLHLEDSANDAALLQHELERGGLDVDVLRVETEEAYRAALTENTWDVILADYRLPRFSAIRALAIYRELRLDLPFILVSGTIDDIAAVECMRAGAHDFLIKDRLARLVPVVRRECGIRLERHRAEERYRLLVENSNDLITEITRSGNVLYASPNHEALLALPPAQLVGRNLFDYVHADDRAQMQAQLTRKDRRSIVYRLRGGDDSPHWLESSGRAFLDSNGAERIVVITRDITQKMKAEEARRQLEAQLRQSQKMEAIGTLAGGIAHDFNNILTGIVGNVQLAQLDPGDRVHTVRCLDEALKAGHRARDLVAQILTFSQQREQPRGATRIGPIVSEALRLLRASLPAGIEIVAEIDPACPAVACDPSQIHQVLMNLGTNAAYAMRERGGTLRVALRPRRFEGELLRRHPHLRAGPGVALLVSDTGDGIDAATKERLFEPFFTTKPVGEGTGLGLAVVHGIVQSHDAAIDVESAPGCGTTFEIYFPAATQRETTPASAPRTLPFGHGEHILLIDDEPAITLVTTQMLQRIGYTSIAFSHPTAALAAFRQTPAAFAAVITDLTMPGMSGLDLAREILAARRDIPVLITTGRLQAGDVARIEAAGIHSTIAKPFTVQLIAESLARALSDARPAPV